MGVGRARGAADPRRVDIRRRRANAEGRRGTTHDARRRSRDRQRAPRAAAVASAATRRAGS